MAFCDAAPSNQQETISEHAEDEHTASDTNAEDIELPRTRVKQVIKEAMEQQRKDIDTHFDRHEVPKATRISAKTTTILNRCTAAFVMYLADAAKERARGRKRLTVTAEDVLEALRDCDFEDIAKEVIELRHQN